MFLLSASYAGHSRMKCVGDSKALHLGHVPSPLDCHARFCPKPNVPALIWNFKVIDLNPFDLLWLGLYLGAPYSLTAGMAWL